MLLGLSPILDYLLGYRMAGPWSHRLLVGTMGSSNTSLVMGHILNDHVSASSASNPPVLGSPLSSDPVLQSFFFFFCVWDSLRRHSLTCFCCSDYALEHPSRVCIPRPILLSFSQYLQDLDSWASFWAMPPMCVLINNLGWVSLTNRDPCWGWGWIWIFGLPHTHIWLTFRLLTTCTASSLNHTKALDHT
jgi:hypothetical protein